MQFVRNFLGQQRKRAIASVMTAIESQFRGKLTDAELRDLRGKVVSAINQYHDTVLDVVKSSVVDDTVLNEHAVRVLAQAADLLTATRRTPEET